MDHIITYTVDGELQETDRKELTANQILSDAEINASSNYLVELKGHEHISFEENPDAEIQMHEHMRFVSVARCPTPVS